MSTSLLKKSLKLFEEEEKVDKIKSNKARPNHPANKKKQATLKDRKVKSALDSFIKKNRKEDKTLENLAVLEKISLKKTVSQDSANKVNSFVWLCSFTSYLMLFFLQILNYHLKKSRKVTKVEPKKEAEKSVFTDEDFRKFELEYFVKGKN